jgi:hypothetical protein
VWNSDQLTKLRLKLSLATYWKTERKKEPGTNSHSGNPVRCQKGPFLSLQKQGPFGSELGATVNAWKIRIKIINSKLGLNTINSKLGCCSNVPWQHHRSWCLSNTGDAEYFIEIGVTVWLRHTIEKWNRNTKTSLFPVNITPFYTLTSHHIASQKAGNVPAGNSWKGHFSVTTSIVWCLQDRNSVVYVD